MAFKQVTLDETAKKLKQISAESPTSITQLLLSLLSTENADGTTLSTHYRIVAGEANELQSRVIAAINTINPDDSECTVNDLLMHASILGRVSSHLSNLAHSVTEDMEGVDQRRQARGTVEQQRQKLEQNFQARMAKHPAVTTVAGKRRPRLFSRTEANF